MKKTFNLETVLSVVTGKIFSREGEQKLFSILSFMTGCDFTNEHRAYLIRAGRACQPFLKVQFPQLLSLGMECELIRLKRGCRDIAETDQEARFRYLQSWLSEVAAGTELMVDLEPLGNIFEVEPIPDGVYQMGSPALEMFFGMACGEK